MEGERLGVLFAVVMTEQSYRCVTGTSETR